MTNRQESATKASPEASTEGHSGPSIMFVAPPGVLLDSWLAAVDKVAEAENVELRCLVVGDETEAVRETTRKPLVLGSLKLVVVWLPVKKYERDTEPSMSGVGTPFTLRDDGVECPVIAVHPVGNLPEGAAFNRYDEWHPEDEFKVLLEVYVEEVAEALKC